MGLVHPDVVLWRKHNYLISLDRILKPIFNSFAKNKGGVRLITTAHLQGQDNVPW
jgi:hypothetical protein